MNDATGVNSTEAALSMRLVDGEARILKAVCIDQRFLER